MDNQEGAEKLKLSQKLYAEKRYPEALAVLDELDGAFPLSKNIMYRRALCLAKVGQFADADAICRQLVGLFGDERANELIEKINPHLQGSAALDPMGLSDLGDVLAPLYEPMDSMFGVQAGSAAAPVSAIPVEDQKASLLSGKGLCTAVSAQDAGNATGTLPSGKRIATIDQLRGYAIFGMLIVNFLGHFAGHGVPTWFNHQSTYYTWADTIAPLFIFVVGMGFRISLVRAIEREGGMKARWAALKRYLILFFVAVAFYGPEWWIDWWDALSDIALAGILCLPFIDKGRWTRIVVGFVYLGIFTAVFYLTPYWHWLELRSMNGGPVGPFAWAFTLLMGTVALDVLQARDSKQLIVWCLAWGVGLIALSYVVYRIMPLEVGPVRDSISDTYLSARGQWWPYIKRWSMAPYIFYSTGWCVLIMLFFYAVNDMIGYKFPHLTTLGKNPLVLYLVQYSILEISGSFLADEDGFVSKETFYAFSGIQQTLVAVTGFAVFYFFIYGCAKKLQDQGIIIKL